MLHGVPTILTKGAVDVLLDRCDYVRCSDGIRPMTEAEKDKIRMQNQLFSENGLRVLSFAYKESDENLDIHAEYGYTFLGLISMVDPPREESAAAVAASKRAGIRPVMITGDHKVTAVAIARRIGIYEEGDLALTGAELDAMSDSELEEQIAQISVYARVSPENKIRIVEAWQRRGNIVSMTGDGVNDAPALKKANVGIAMGGIGSDIAVDAADIALVDDEVKELPHLLGLSKRMMVIIKCNLTFSMSLNFLAIILAMTGILNPVVGAFGIGNRNLLSASGKA